MIKEQKVYAATCDNCLQTWQEEVHGMTISTGKDRHHLKDAVEESGWHITSRGQTYCGQCHSFDENDRLVLNQEREVQP